MIMAQFRFLALLPLMLLGFAASAGAQSLSPVGSWRGEGIVRPYSGSPERTPCRGVITKAPGRGAYDGVLRCSTSGGVVTQAGRLRWVGGNTYRGTFYDDNYDVRGSVSAVVRRSTMSVSVVSNKGTGRLSLRR